MKLRKDIEYIAWELLSLLEFDLRRINSLIKCFEQQEPLTEKEDLEYNHLLYDKKILEKMIKNNKEIIEKATTNGIRKYIKAGEK